MSNPSVAAQESRLESLTFDSATAPNRALELEQGTLLRNDEAVEFSNDDVMECAQEIIDAQITETFTNQAAIICYAATYLNWGSGNGLFTVQE